MKIGTMIAERTIHSITHWPKKKIESSRHTHILLQRLQPEGYLQINKGRARGVSAVIAESHE
jgi:hypothetical protein